MTLSIKGPDEWPFPIPKRTRMAIDDLVANYNEDDPLSVMWQDQVYTALRLMDNQHARAQLADYYLYGGMTRR